jgi:hypothetical protein
MRVSQTMSQTNRRDFLKDSARAGLACSAAGASLLAALPEEKPERKRLTVLAIEGTPHERGLTHGRTLKEQIHSLVRLWKADLAARYALPAETFVQKFLKHTDYLPAMKRWTPDLIEEVRGIAEGAELDFDTLLAFQLIDEYWVHGPSVGGEHCSALGIRRRGERPSYLAQNMDLEGFRDGFQIILRIKQADPKRETLVLTHAGLIGLNGLSSRSVGICCNTLSQLAFCKDGLPVACVIRGALEQPTVEAAVGFLRRVKHASGQNYIVGGPEAVHDLECSAGKVVSFAPEAAPDVVWHTNHPLVNDDYHPKHRAALEKNEAPKGENSAARLQSLQRRLGKVAADSGLELIRTTLVSKDSADYPVCRLYKNRQEIFTFASVILELSDRAELHVTAGPPDVHPYQQFSFGR